MAPVLNVWVSVVEVVTLIILMYVCLVLMGLNWSQIDVLDVQMDALHA